MQCKLNGQHLTSCCQSNSFFDSSYQICLFRNSQDRLSFTAKRNTASRLLQIFATTIGSAKRSQALVDNQLKMSLAPIANRWDSAPIKSAKVRVVTEHTYKTFLLYLFRYFEWSLKISFTFTRFVPQRSLSISQARTD